MSKNIAALIVTVFVCLILYGAFSGWSITFPFTSSGDASAQAAWIGAAISNAILLWSAVENAELRKKVADQEEEARKARSAAARVLLESFARQLCTRCRINARELSEFEFDLATPSDLRRLADSLSLETAYSPISTFNTTDLDEDGLQHQKAMLMRSFAYDERQRWLAQASSDDLQRAFRVEKDQIFGLLHRLSRDAERCFAKIPADLTD